MTGKKGSREKWLARVLSTTHLYTLGLELHPRRTWIKGSLLCLRTPQAGSMGRLELPTVSVADSAPGLQCPGCPLGRCDIAETKEAGLRPKPVFSLATQLINQVLGF